MHNSTISGNSQNTHPACADNLSFFPHSELVEEFFKYFFNRTYGSTGLTMHVKLCDFLKKILSKAIFILCMSVFCLSAAEHFVDFKTGMLPNRSVEEPFVLSNAQWQLGKALYGEYVRTFCLHDEPLVPHIIHHVWLGSPLPAVCARMRQTWFDHNPDWHGILWTDSEENYGYGHYVDTLDELYRLLHTKTPQRIVFDVRHMPLVQRSAYDATTNYGERSDIVRYELLYRFGGLYVDTDFVCLKSFDVLHRSCNFFAGIGYSKTYGLLNGLIGCAAGDLIIKLCIDDLVGKAHANDTSSIIGRTGPGLLTRSFFKAMRAGYAGVAVGFPVTTFYPWPNWDRGNADADAALSWIRPESFAVHYWHVSWQR